MSPDVAARLAAIGGDELVGVWQVTHASTPEFNLHIAESDSISLGYALAAGGLASLVDHLLDKSFREAMADKHELLADEDQLVLERASDQAAADFGLKRLTDNNDAKTSMDWYRAFNKMVGMKKGFLLYSKNHRILNHTDKESVIDMLMKGEAGIGNLRVEQFAKLTREQAEVLFDLHMSADRHTPQSLPLKFMSWLWEQGVKSENPDVVGPPSKLYEALNKLAPNANWAKWLNRFHSGAPIPDGASLGDSMLKLYETGVLNERVFWMSNSGAAIGGMKRRMLITALMEMAVEIYAFFEGVRLGFIDYRAPLLELKEQVLTWRSQPKYLDMRIAAQGMASAGGVAKAAVSGDVLNINYFSLGMMLKHVWTYPAVEDQHTQRLVQHSESARRASLAAFTAKTGIVIRPQLTSIKGGLPMPGELSERLLNAGCYSTRLRVLATNNPQEMKELVTVYERMAKKADENPDGEEFFVRFDSMRDSWYLSELHDDEAAIRQLKIDLNAVLQLEP